jgi:hypothetical protein
MSESSLMASIELLQHAHPPRSQVQVMGTPEVICKVMLKAHSLEDYKYEMHQELGGEDAIQGLCTLREEHWLCEFVRELACETSAFAKSLMEGREVCIWFTVWRHLCAWFGFSLTKEYACMCLCVRDTMFTGIWNGAPGIL